MGQFGYCFSISGAVCKWNCVVGAGAKGKFSGGFDITAFGGLQEGQKRMFN